MIKIEIESNTGTHQQNEDYTANLQLSDTCYAVAVADGMGGLENGEIASKTAVDTFNKYVQAHYKDTEKQDCIHQALYEADIPFKHHKLSEGDKILICTDGYYKHDDSDDSTTMTITI